jgi:hypothetical protein
LVRLSERKLKELGEIESEDTNDDQSNPNWSNLLLKIVRGSIKVHLATKLRDIAYELRKREKMHYLKVSELHDDDKKTKNEVDKFLNDDGHMQVLEEEDD